MIVQNVIPSWATLEESVFYVLEDSDRNYNEMMTGFALEELSAVAEANGVVSDGVEKIKQIKNAIIKFFVDTFNRIKELIKKGIEMIKEKFTQIGSKISAKMVEGARARLGNIKDKEYGYTYDYHMLKGLFKNGAITDEVAAKACDQFVNDIINAKNQAAEDGSNLNEKLLAMKNQMLKASGLNTDAKESDIRKKIVTLCRADASGKMNKQVIDKGYLTEHFDEMANVISAYPKIVKAVNDYENKNKKLIDKAIQDVKKDKKSNSTVYSVCMPYYKFAMHYVTILCGSVIGAVREKVSKDLSIMLRLCVTTKKVSESAYMESGSYQAEVASLFDWNF